MAIPNDILGVWMGNAMGQTTTRSYDVLVFNPDGTGFHDLYDVSNRCTERFRWVVESPLEIRLEGCQSLHFEPTHSNFEERPTTLNTTARFTIQEEEHPEMGPVRTLRLDPSLSPGASNYFVFYRRDIPVQATFRAPCFDRDDEPADAVFRGQALSDFLAEALTTRQLAVGERTREFMGCCWYRRIQLAGSELGFAVNWDRDLEKWWVRIDRPESGRTAELESLQRLLDEILRRTDGVQDLLWQTEEEWLTDPPGQAHKAESTCDPAP